MHTLKPETGGDAGRAVKDTSNRNGWCFGVSGGGECDAFLSGFVRLIKCAKVGGGAEVDSSQTVCRGFSNRKFVFLFFSFWTAWSCLMVKNCDAKVGGPTKLPPLTSDSLSHSDGDWLFPAAVSMIFRLILHMLEHRTLNPPHRTSPHLLGAASPPSPTATPPLPHLSFISMLINSPPRSV